MFTLPKRKSHFVTNGLLATLTNMGKGKGKGPLVHKPPYAPGWTDVHFNLGRTGIPHPEHNFQEYEGTVDTFLQAHMPKLVASLEDMLEQGIRQKWSDQNGQMEQSAIAEVKQNMEQAAKHAFQQSLPAGSNFTPSNLRGSVHEGRWSYEDSKLKFTNTKQHSSSSTIGGTPSNRRTFMLGMPKSV